MSYRELDETANRVARALRRLGVAKGDRVALWTAKSAMTIATMQGALRIGAVYVPIDPSSPVGRVKTILTDCQARAVVCSRDRERALVDAGLAGVAVLSTDAAEGPSWSTLGEYPCSDLEPLAVVPDDMAYILYTSGSTGIPKGVCISHRNALAFVEWAVEALGAGPEDRFANHAPFHFDLSVLDLYAAFAVGACVVIVPEGLSFIPEKLVQFVKRTKPTVWYSVPSALVMMIDQGAFLDMAEPSLRAILFAGEPFPVAPLRRMRERWPSMRLLNLYGPTETNACTFHEVGQERLRNSIPIGKACSGNRVWVRKDDGSEGVAGDEGELFVDGPTVMLGYWGRPRVVGPYATGDIVRLEDDGSFTFIGRRDHLVKVRGHRIELGEIEAALMEHPCVRAVAATTEGEGHQARLVAYVVCRGRPSLVELKRHCAARLARYMIIDRVVYIDELPRNANGKIDRLNLAALAQREPQPESRRAS